MVYPSVNKINLSNLLKTLVLGWWIVEITVFPQRACSFNRSMSTSALKLSRPDVGSSRMMIDGFEIISIAMLVLLRSPPEIPLRITLPIILSATFSSLKAAITASTFSAISRSVPGILILAENMIDSLTVIVGHKMSIWVIYAAIFL
ncbi:unnamed protein product [Blepharisma stoltei]|uniref:Uncharacterized protein n=1 Tax=Blepharisma stoltei TaxID=1481888 RepID=A0AAU9JRN7_9CILI|nr:unnamed protein product [Blepharisma stoltei]